MDEFMKQALEIAKAQAGVRAMTTEQIMEFTNSLAEQLRGASAPLESADAAVEAAPVDGRKSIREKSVTCLVCGKAFKMLGKKHLAGHGLTPAEYREKFGLKKGASLVCKELVRARRKKMNEMELWKRREKTAETVEA